MPQIGPYSEIARSESPYWWLTHEAAFVTSSSMRFSSSCLARASSSLHTLPEDSYVVFGNNSVMACLLMKDHDILAKRELYRHRSLRVVQVAEPKRHCRSFWRPANFLDLLIA